jgi:hypothetical protein
MAQTRGDYTPAVVFRKGNIFVQCERQNAWIPRLAGLSATTTCRTEHSDCSLSCAVMLAQMRNRALVAPMQNKRQHFRWPFSSPKHGFSESARVEWAEKDARAAACSTAFPTDKRTFAVKSDYLSAV